MNGNGRAHDDDADDLTHEEQTAHILTLVRSERVAGAERDMQFGRVAAELSRNTDANIDATHVQREIVVALKQLVPRLAMQERGRDPEALPKMRAPLPSMFDVDPDDKTDLREFKEQAKAVLALKYDHDVAKAVATTNTGRLKMLALVLGILVSLTVLAGVAWKVLSDARAPTVTAPSK